MFSLQHVCVGVIVCVQHAPVVCASWLDLCCAFNVSVSIGGNSCCCKFFFVLKSITLLLLSLVHFRVSATTAVCRVWSVTLLPWYATLFLVSTDGLSAVAPYAAVLIVLACMRICRRCTLSLFLSFFFVVVNLYCFKVDNPFLLLLLVHFCVSAAAALCRRSWLVVSFFRAAVCSNVWRKG